MAFSAQSARMKRAGTSSVNAVKRETITERHVHFQSSDRKWPCLFVQLCACTNKCTAKWTCQLWTFCVFKGAHSEVPARLCATLAWLLRRVGCLLRCLNMRWPEPPRPQERSVQPRSQDKFSAAFTGEVPRGGARAMRLEQLCSIRAQRSCAQHRWNCMRLHAALWRLWWERWALAEMCMQSGGGSVPHGMYYPVTSTTNQERAEVGVLVAVGETVILLLPPLPLAGVSTWMERGCQ